MFQVGFGYDKDIRVIATDQINHKILIRIMFTVTLVYGHTFYVGLSLVIGLAVPILGVAVEFIFIWMTLLWQCSISFRDMAAILALNVTISISELIKLGVNFVL